MKGQKGQWKKDEREFPSSILLPPFPANSKILLVAIGTAGVAIDFTSSHSEQNPTKSLLVAIGPVFTSSHPEQRS